MKINIINKTEFELPKYETIGSAGMDLRANLKKYDHAEYDDILKKWTLLLEPHKQYVVPTGLHISLPGTIIGPTGEGWGYEAQIRPRSGLAAKHGITFVNSVGTIDCDYRGEIKIILMNISNIPYKIEDGDRIGQIIINRFEKIIWNEVTELDSTERGEGGFSSTGKN